MEDWVGSSIWTLVSKIPCRYPAANIAKMWFAGFVLEEDPSKINLFVMVFETWERDADINSCITLVVFDMNQWYKAQMPHQCYPGYSVPFVNFMVLEQVSERKSTILDVCIKKDTIQQFLTFNLSEEYSYPSSLTFGKQMLVSYFVKVLPKVSRFFGISGPGNMKSM